MNEISVIHPYRYEGMWVFDDPAVGLLREPFVSGTDALIDAATRQVPHAETGFTLIFSANRFPGSHLNLEWRREELSGNWYYSSEFEAEGWLCPALFKYFDKAPQHIFIQIKPKAAAR